MRTAQRGVTLLELLIVAAISTVLALSSVAIFTRHTDSARVVEAKATMQLLLSRARVVYQRTDKVPNTLSELKMAPGDLASENFTADSFKFNSSGKNWKVTCEWVYRGSNPPHLTVTINLVTGDVEYKR